MTQTTPSQRGADWLVGLMMDDGRIRGDTSINEYYKTVFGLCCAGRGVEADRMLDYVVRRFLREDGGLDGRGCEWFDQFPVYPHAWVLMAAIMRARTDLVNRLCDYILTFHDVESGGYYTTAMERDRGGEQDMMTTGLAAIALLWAGRLEAARRTGLWLERLWQAQPDPHRHLYFVWTRQSGLVRAFPADRAKAYVVDASQPAQRYFQFGIACALLTQLGAATGESRWHALASHYLLVTRSYREDVFNRPQSGKIGWGAAWRYRLLRQPEDLEMVQTIHDNLAAAQDAQGWWSAASVYAASAEPVAVTPGIDLTAEFVAHFHWMESAMALASSSTPPTPTPAKTIH